jgi:hypothetical protein
MMALYLCIMFCIILWCKFEHDDLNLKLWEEALLKLVSSGGNDDEFRHDCKVYVLMRDNVCNRK